MAVYEYQPGEHGGGFVGVRVGCYVAGELRSRHFSFRRNHGRFCSKREQNRLRKEARELDARWKAEREAARLEGRPWATRIKGISATFEVRRKQRSGGVQVYYAPIFKVQGSTESRRFQRAFRIPTLGYDQAWKMAVEFYARNKGRRQWADLRRMRPPPEQFRRVRREMNARGFAIPASKLPTA